MSNCNLCEHYNALDEVCTIQNTCRCISEEDRENGQCSYFKAVVASNIANNEECSMCDHYEKGYCKKKGPKTKVKGKCVWFKLPNKVFSLKCASCKKYDLKTNSCISDGKAFYIIMHNGTNEECADYIKHPDHMDGDRVATMRCSSCDKLKMWKYVNGDEQPVCEDGEKRYYLTNKEGINTRYTCNHYICMNKKEYYIPDCESCAYYNAAHHTCSAFGEERDFALDDITSIIPSVKCQNYKKKYEGRFKVDTCFYSMCHKCTRLTPKLDYDICTSSSKGTSGTFCVTCKYMDECLEED